MSVISNVHTAIVYEAKGANKSQAYEGQRGVVTIAKADKNGNYGQYLQQTMFTSIPDLARADIDFSDSTIQNLCVDYFKTVQNSIIAERIKSGQNSVQTEDIAQAAIVVHLMSEASGEKWDAARIATWFNDTLAEFIGLALIDKGFPESKIEQSLEAYSKLIADTFSSRGVIARKKAEAIDKAFKLVPSESQDSTFGKFSARIAKVLEESDMGELLGL